MSASVEPTDEFALVAEEAAERGLPAPASLRRVDGLLSALRWGTDPLGLVWLHGAGLDAHTFDATVLACGLPSLAIDLPGHGQSPWRADADYRPETNVAAVAGTMAANGVGTAGSASGGGSSGALVIGHSLGGLTGIALAARRPELVAGLVVIDVTPGLGAGDAQPVRDFLAGASSFASRQEIVDRATRFGLGGSAAALRRGVYLNTRIRDDGRVVFRHHFAQLPADQQLPSDFSTLWPMAEDLRIPVLLVRATEGFLTDPLEAEFLARVPGSSVVRIGSGHNVQEQAPIELAAAVSAVLPPLAQPPGVDQPPAGSVDGDSD